jgi:hypothetical protein
MRKWSLKALGGAIVAIFAFWVIFTVAMRRSYEPVVKRVRYFNRTVGNPRAMLSAGQPGAYASVIQHVGRSSGSSYETPIVPFATDDGFVVPLPYGSTADWVRNVLAADSAVIINEGTAYRVEAPEVIASDIAMVDIPPKNQWSLRLYNVDQFLLVRTVAR